MKYFLTTVVTTIFLSCISYGQTSTSFTVMNLESEGIYNALDVEVISPVPGSLGFVGLEKKVGGLICVKVRTIHPGDIAGATDNFICSLHTMNDPESIYRALNVKAVNAAPGVTAIQALEKKVGGLVCTKVRNLFDPEGKDSYGCILESTN